MQKGLNLLGLARKANKIVLGTDAVIMALAKEKIKLIIVATDASDKTYDKLDKKAYFYHIIIKKIYKTSELSEALGIPLVKVIGLTDEGFTKALLKEIERGDF